MGDITATSCLNCDSPVRNFQDTPRKHMSEREQARRMRLDTRVRGVVITALIAGYGLLFRQPQGSFAEALLIGAVLQGIVMLVRRRVPPDAQPAALYVFEMIADGVTVLMFALGVLGGIYRMGAEI
jgi:hypothetical protein